MINQQSKKQTALITGASSGIGCEFAKIFAREGYDLILVARDETRLNAIEQALSTQYAVHVTVISKDLSIAGVSDALYAEMQQENIAVDVLVNNAGFATYGYFVDIALTEELQMMQLNVVTLTHLTKLFVSDMKTRGHGKVLNIASTAAFQPGPLMAVYYATKAYVLSLSEALAEELRGTGVTVTALCPGPTESGFQKRAAMEDSKLVQNGLMSATVVAEIGYQAMLHGETVVVPGAQNKLLAFLTRFVPRRMATRMVMSMQGRVIH